MIRNQWYAILPSKEVKKGKILAVIRLNLELALFRDEKGKIGCVIDKCSHRGARLSKGRVEGECIRCPFHGLEFDKEGKCRLIPANGRSSIPDERYNVESLQVIEKNGIIYLWYGDKEKITSEVPFFSDHLDESYSWSEIEDHWNSHYSRCIENQLDVVHLPIVHYNTIGKGNKTLINGPKIEFLNGILRTCANNEVDTGQKPKAPKDCEIFENLYLQFIFPNLWMNHISNKVKVIIFFAPVDDENTILYIRFYNKITRIRLFNSLIAFIGKFANKIIERQDKRVVITQKPKASSMKSDEKLLTGDGPIILYRKIREELKNK